MKFLINSSLIKLQNSGNLFKLSLKKILFFEKDLVKFDFLKKFFNKCCFFKKNFYGLTLIYLDFQLVLRNFYN